MTNTQLSDREAKNSSKFSRCRVARETWLQRLGGSPVSDVKAKNSLILSRVLGTLLFGPGPKQLTQSKRRDGRTGSVSSAKAQVTDDSGWHREHGLTWLGGSLITLFGLSVTLATGCGGDTSRHLVEAGGDSGTASHTGGTSHAGGTHGTGGTTSWAGNFATGGATPVGGATSATAQTGGSGGSTSDTVSTGGASTSGGANTTGGTKATGGANAAGGTKATGGTLATGGSNTMAVGGSTAAGTKATGGAATGGAGGGAATGASRATGGTKATGGAATGGTRATGGAATGGAAAGGTRATGGTATGGTLATGGAATAATGGAATGGTVNTGGSDSSGGSGTGGTSAACPDLSQSCGDNVCQEGCETVQSCAADCGALVFANGNARRVTTPIWVSGDNIAECGMQPMTGLSVSTTYVVAGAHAALCGFDDPIMFPHTACTAFAFGQSDQRYYTATGDWDLNFYKGECAQDGYVAGIGAPASGVVDALLCCTGQGISHTNCATVSMYNGEAREPGVTSGDRDFGYYKGECGPGRYIAGVAANKDTQGTHSILCCSP